MPISTDPSPEVPFVEPEPAVRYQAISRVAVVSVVLGVLSLLTIFDWFFALIPLAGLMVAWLAVRQIRDRPAEVTGQWLAWTGLGLCLAFWALGAGWLLLARAQEVPFGYQRIEFEELQPTTPGQDVPLGVEKLQDKKVFIKGFIKPSRQHVRLKRFVFCRATADCQFCKPNPMPTEMISVTLSGDMETDYTSRLIGLGGTFRVDPQARSGIPYAIEVDYLP
jgi:hypothetical protein